MVLGSMQDWSSSGGEVSRELVAFGGDLRWRVTIVQLVTTPAMRTA